MKRVMKIVGCALLAAAGWWGWLQLHPKTQPTQQWHGNVEIRGVDWGFRVSGRVLEVLKQEGDAVKAGECLARLDAAPYRYELDMRRAEEAAAKAKWQQSTRGYRSEEIAQAMAQLEQARASHHAAQAALQRHQSLIDGGGTSRQWLDDSTAAATYAFQAMRVAEARLQLLQAGFRAEEIETAHQHLLQASAARAAAELRLRDTELIAASDGTVLTRFAEPGSIVQAGTTVLGVALNHPVWIRAYAAEPSLPQLAPGTAVTITADGIQHPYQGTIGFVSPRAEFTPKSVETPELRTQLVYRLRVVVECADDQLRQGMPVTITLTATPP